MQPKLGILAGGGRLPADIVDICRRTGRAFHVIAFAGQADDALCEDTPHTNIRLGAAGRTLKALRENDVEEIIFVGSISRPSLAEMRPDSWGVKFLARSGAMALGDDGFLTSLIRTLEKKEGFRVVGVGDVARELLAPLGAIGSIQPSGADQPDIRVAVSAARELGAKDVGQAAVSRNGRVIGLEDSSGTDALLHRISPVPAAEPQGSPVGVLAKVAKPQQERRADLPAIGVDTVRNAARAGLAGIVVEAGAAIVLERDRVADIADELELFVVGIRTDDFLDA